MIRKNEQYIIRQTIKTTIAFEPVNPENAVPDLLSMVTLYNLTQRNIAFLNLALAIHLFLSKHSSIRNVFPHSGILKADIFNNNDKTSHLIGRRKEIIRFHKPCF